MYGQTLPPDSLGLDQREIKQLVSFMHLHTVGTQNVPEKLPPIIDGGNWRQIAY